MSRDAFCYENEPREMYRAALVALTGAKVATVDRLVEAYPDGRGLAAATIPQLRACGCTLAQATRILAAYRLVRAADCRAEDRSASLRTPARVAETMRAHGIGDLEQEVFYAVLLNARQRVIDILEVGRGSLAHVDVHPREVFAAATRIKAHSIIVAHNHPSGDPDPSDADLELTRRLCEAGRLLGIPVLDHLILTRDQHLSMAALGMVP